MQVDHSNSFRLRDSVRLAGVVAFAKVMLLATFELITGLNLSEFTDFSHLSSVRALVQFQQVAINR